MIVGVDKDALMLQKAKERLHEFGAQVVYVGGSYASLQTITKQTNISQFDLMLLDLGVNMEHFKDGDRGFSIKQNGPLDMRFDTSQGLTAGQRLERCTPPQFDEMLTQYTDFSPKRNKHLADSFFSSSRKFISTGDLKTRAKSIGMNEKALAIFFQAIRIAVNHELQELSFFLSCFADYLTTG